jgi:CRP-like cAMP-binding protein
MEKNSGEIIIREGDDDDGGCFYLVLGPLDAQVEVVRMVNDAEEFLTRLGAGEYFGQKYFMNNRTVMQHTIAGLMFFLYNISHLQFAFRCAEMRLLGL